MGKRTFTAEYKTQVVLEVLREEKQLGEIAAGHGTSPNQLRNWKREFLGIQRKQAGKGDPGERKGTGSRASRVAVHDRAAYDGA